MSQKYFYVVAGRYDDARRFARGLSVPEIWLRFIDDPEKLMGLRGIRLHVFKSAANLPQYDAIIQLAKINEIDISDGWEWEMTNQVANTVMITREEYDNLRTEIALLIAENKRIAIANKDNADELQERIDFLTDQNKRLFEALWRVASGDIPRNLGARKRCNHDLFDTEDCAYCTEDFAKAILAETKGGEE